MSHLFAQCLVSTLHIGPGAGTTCATGCAGDPNQLGGADDVDIYQTSSGAPTLSQPVLLIFGVPSNFAKFFPTTPILSVTAINPYPGGTQTAGTAAIATAGTYGLKAPVSGSDFGTMGPGQEVYSFLNLPSANKSNNFTNWSGADAGPESLINCALAENVPKGTFFVAYSQANGKAYDTPFTEAGLKTGYSRQSSARRPATSRPARSFDSQGLTLQGVDVSFRKVQAQPLVRLWEVV